MGRKPLLIIAGAVILGGAFFIFYQELIRFALSYVAIGSVPQDARFVFGWVQNETLFMVFLSVFLMVGGTLIMLQGLRKSN